jgi:hypothetical protein
MLALVETIFAGSASRTQSLVRMVHGLHLISKKKIENEKRKKEIPRTEECAARHEVEGFEC